MINRKDFIRACSIALFIPIKLEERGEDIILRKHYKYYFGAYGSGKTTRLVSDAIIWLDANRADGLFVVNHPAQIRSIYLYVLACGGKDSWLSRAIFKHSENTLYISNGSTLKFMNQTSETPFHNYQGLWTDQITKENREILRNNIIAGPRVTAARIQHAISMDEAHELHRKFGFNPILLSKYNNYISPRPRISRLWAFA